MEKYVNAGESCRLLLRSTGVGSSLLEGASDLTIAAVIGVHRLNKTLGQSHVKRFLIRSGPRHERGFMGKLAVTSEFSILCVALKRTLSFGIPNTLYT